MDEVFSSQPDLTVSQSAIWTLNISQMAATLSGMAHALLVCGDDFGLSY
jgi:hypothetical protein